MRLSWVSGILGCLFLLVSGCSSPGDYSPSGDAWTKGDVPKVKKDAASTDGPGKMDYSGKKKEVGQPCGGNNQCKEGRCHLGVCVAAKLQGNGTPCTKNAQCKSMSCVGGKCAPGTAAKGTACLSKDECASGLCLAGKCAPPPVGTPCSKDSECASGICYAQKCAKACTKPADCLSGEVCNTDNGKRVFCLKPSYNSGLGKFCGVSGACASGLTCVGSKYDWGTFCRGTCTSDLACPPAMECETATGSTRYCRPRRMCSQCAHDGSCPSSMKCVAMLGGKYCTSSCNPGSTECPMASECKAAAGGNFCQPKSGSCKGNGAVCASCTKNDHCKAGGLCLSFSLSEENFCGADCTSSGSCAGGYKCYTVNSATGKKQCGPALKSGGLYPTCTSGITFPIFGVGDVIDDFAMVGYRDSNNNGTLTDETNLQVIKLSDMAKGAKLILLNISAFW